MTGRACPACAAGQRVLRPGLRRAPAPPAWGGAGHWAGRALAWPGRERARVRPLSLPPCRPCLFQVIALAQPFKLLLCDLLQGAGAVIGRGRGRGWAGHGRGREHGYAGGCADGMPGPRLSHRRGPGCLTRAQAPPVARLSWRLLLPPDQQTRQPEKANCTLPSRASGGKPARQKSTAGCACRRPLHPTHLHQLCQVPPKALGMAQARGRGAHLLLQLLLGCRQPGRQRHLCILASPHRRPRRCSREAALQAPRGAAPRAGRGGACKPLLCFALAAVIALAVHEAGPSQAAAAGLAAAAAVRAPPLQALHPVALAAVPVRGAPVERSCNQSKARHMLGSAATAPAPCTLRVFAGMRASEEAQRIACQPTWLPPGAPSAAAPPLQCLQGMAGRREGGGVERGWGAGRGLEG